MTCDSYLQMLRSENILLCVSEYCNFDSQSLCSFTQDTNDDFNWTFNKGPTTSTPSTGPTADFSGIGNVTHYTITMSRNISIVPHLHGSIYQAFRHTFPSVFISHYISTSQASFCTDGSPRASITRSG